MSIDMAKLILRTNAERRAIRKRTMRATSYSAFEIIDLREVHTRSLNVDLHDKESLDGAGGVKRALTLPK
jgi:hypothetical protein